MAAGVDEKHARQKWQAAFTTNTLSADFPLHFQNLGTVTVADVLANPRRFDWEHLADPADPTYAEDPRIATFFANGGKARPHIFSYAHGGCKYVLVDEIGMKSRSVAAFKVREGFRHRQEPPTARRQRPSARDAGGATAIERAAARIRRRDTSSTGVQTMTDTAEDFKVAREQ